VAARARGQAQMREDLGDHRRIFDGGDDLQGAATVRAMLNINVGVLTMLAVAASEMDQTTFARWLREHSVKQP